MSLVPTIIWQSQHGWPQIAMSRAVAAEGVYTGGAVGFLPLTLVETGRIAPFFTSRRRVGTIDNGQDVDNTQGLPIYVLDGRTRPWSVIWPRIRTI